MLRIIRFLTDCLKDVFSPGFCVFLAVGLVLLLITTVFLPKSRLLENYHQVKAKERAEEEEKLRQGIVKLRREIPEVDEYFKHQERCEAAISEWLDESQQATPEAQKKMSLSIPEAVKRACRDAAADDAEEAK